MKAQHAYPDIYAYITQKRGVRLSWVSSRIGIDNGLLSKKLRGVGKWPSEDLNADDVIAIANLLKVDDVIRDAWLAALQSSDRTAA